MKHKLFTGTILITLFTLFSQIPGFDDAIRNSRESNQTTWGDVNRMQGAIDRQNQIDKQNAQINTQKVKEYYYSLSEYPQTISDGWHKVIALNNNDVCDERKVYVSNNRVMKYINRVGYEIQLSSYPKIMDGKTSVQLLGPDGKVFDFVELYFLDAINSQ